MNRIRANAVLFRDGAVLSYIALFRWFRPSSYLASKIVMPLAEMMFFVLIGTFGSDSLGIDFFVIGNAVQIAAVSGIYGVTMSIGGDRWNGTLTYLFGTPANRLVLFAGRSVVHLFDGFLGVFIAFLWGMLLFGLRIPAESILPLVLTVAVTTFSTSGLGLLMGCVGLVTRNVMFVNNTMYFLLLFFSGANVPLERLPGWVAAVSGVLPLTGGIAASRLVIAGGSFADVFPLILREGAVGIAYFAIGYAMFAGLEKVAKKTGSLETM